MTSTEEHTENHEAFIKTPRQLIVTVIMAFVVPIVIIIMLVNLVAVSSPAGTGSDAQTTDAVVARIKPIANFKLVDASAPKAYMTGKQGFDNTCTARSEEHTSELQSLMLSSYAVFCLKQKTNK